MVEGRYFHPHSARCVPARALLGESKSLRITTAEGEALAEAPFRSVKVSSRLGDIPRRLAFPDGGCFETGDNDGVDELLREARLKFGHGWIDRLESSWRSVVAALVITCALGVSFVIWGIPAIARVLADQTPPVLAAMVSDQTMEVLDEHYLKPSQLTPAQQQRAQALFARVTAATSCAPYECRLMFRGGAQAGANAFALPDGRVVVTDDLWTMIKNDDEALGVFAHEISHVTHAHGLQRAYEASLIPATIAVITGDVSQVSQLAVILPGILMQSAYSRSFEREADAEAARVVKQLGGKPSALGDLLERLEHRTCGKKGCGPSWLGDHPETSRRVDALRSEDRQK